MRANYESNTDGIEIELLDNIERLDHGREFDGGVVHVLLDDRPAVIDLLGASSELERKVRTAAEETGADADSLLLLVKTAVANPDRTVVVELLERA